MTPEAARKSAAKFTRMKGNFGVTKVLYTCRFDRSNTSDIMVQN